MRCRYVFHDFSQVQSPCNNRCRKHPQSERNKAVSLRKNEIVCRWRTRHISPPLLMIQLRRNHFVPVLSMFVQINVSLFYHQISLLLLRRLKLNFLLFRHQRRRLREVEDEALVECLSLLHQIRLVHCTGEDYLLATRLKMVKFTELNISKF